jgi:hypothetical protein
MGEISLEFSRSGLFHSPIKLALIGAVSRASLLPVLAGHEDASVCALVDRDEEHGRDLASPYDVGRVLSDADHLTKKEVDALVPATPPPHHGLATIAAAAKGLHVSVEKPLALTGISDCAMVHAGDAADVVLSVGSYRRFRTSARLLKRLNVDAAVVCRRATGAGGDLMPYHGDPAPLVADRAARDVKFVPAVSRECAMALTLEWTAAARLVGAAGAAEVVWC